VAFLNASCVTKRCKSRGTDADNSVAARYAKGVSSGSRIIRPKRMGGEGLIQGTIA
jgi:hypothetical protein